MSKNVVTPLNAVKLRHAVEAHRLRRAVIKRVARRVPLPLLLTWQRAVLGQQTSGAFILPATPAEGVISPQPN